MVSPRRLLGRQDETGQTDQSLPSFSEAGRPVKDLV
jgi:hypothetical protein